MLSINGNVAQYKKYKQQFQTSSFLGTWNELDEKTLIVVELYAVIVIFVVHIVHLIW